MYCIKCGVELRDSEKCCPLCGTAVFHPDLTQEKGERSYPLDEKSNMKEVNLSGLMFVLSMLVLLPAVICVLCDYKINSSIVWSGYVFCGIALLYIMVLLPLWFKRPNPVIFGSADFAGIALLLLYIDLKTEGGWFLSFAFPVVGALALIVMTVVTLVRYLPKSAYLYITAGALFSFGGFALLLEFLLNLTFKIENAIFWSVFPLAIFSILGAVFLVIAICRPLRESLRKSMFI